MKAKEVERKKNGSVSKLCPIYEKVDERGKGGGRN
jgi:hypothetical protein